MITSRSSSFDKASVSGRSASVSAGQNTLVNQQQGHSSSTTAHHTVYHPAKAATVHPSHTSASQQQQGAMFNTELRAQARKERDAIRDRAPQMRGPQQQQQSLLSNVGMPGRERSSSILSNHVSVNGERRISPPKTLAAKKSTEYDGRCPSVASRTTSSRHGRKISTGPIPSDNVNRPRPPLQPSTSFNFLNYSGDDENAWHRKPYDLPSRIPSPPTSEDSRDFESGQNAYIVKYYHEAVEKCQGWQRYAASMKAKFETSDLENKILRDVNERQKQHLQDNEAAMRSLEITNRAHEANDENQQHQIRSLEAELARYKQATLLQERGKRSLTAEQGTGSGHSDAVTVTGDYLQDIVDQKRRLRKVSQDQQQQLQYLQARVHLNSNTSQGSVHSTAGGGSRPSSRLSNRNTDGLRIRSRSRAGSCTVHDSIPIEKDDVFGSSDALPIAPPSAPPIKRSSSMPLTGINLTTMESERLEVRESKSFPGDASSKASTTGVSLQEQSTPLPEGHTDPTEPESDRKGAHRRLYIRLRDELETSDLVRFERYVHRYDGLEIPVEGNRGIINRVRRLLLPEELVRSKLDLPDRYKLRKELAREFERIVREDASPRETSNTSNSQQEESI